MHIVREMDHEDQIITTHRIGRTIVIRTERPSIARSVLRQIEDSLAPESPEVKGSAIGFRIEE